MGSLPRTPKPLQKLAARIDVLQVTCSVWRYTQGIIHKSSKHDVLEEHMSNEIILT